MIAKPFYGVTPMIELVIQILILAISLITLVLSSHFTISSIERLIELTGLSEVSTGFAILAIMTSSPEVIIALFSVLQGTPGISIGDIIGSNVFNVGAVIGILGMLGYLKMCCTDLLVELTDILFITSLIPLLLVIFKVASPIIGVILLGTFVLAIYFMTRRRTPIVASNKSVVVAKRSKKPTFAKLILGISAVIVSARLVVLSGLNLAVSLGVAPILVGAKIVAIGTSLPELTLDLTAVKRGRVHLAIGDILGSNLTNLTLVLGLVLVSSPFAVDMTIFTEILPFLLITTIVFWRFLTRGGVSQIGGIVLIMVYVLFQAII